MRDQKDHNKLVARTEDGEYVFCQYIFHGELHGEPFNGAVGTTLRPVPKSEYDERTSQEGVEDYCEEIWQQTVAAGETKESLEDWARQAYQADGDDMLWDQSYAHELAPQLRALGISKEDYPVIECTGGGRMFGRDETYAEVYDAELLAEIREVESR